jgi:hypothetical protein
MEKVRNGTFIENVLKCGFATWRHNDNNTKY